MSFPLRRRLAAGLALGLLATIGAPARGAEPMAVTVRNESVAATCAETDNVSLSFVSGAVRRFRIAAQHPAYIGTLLADSTAPDFSRCDGPGDPVATTPAAPADGGAKRITLYETPDLWLVGHVFPSFWQPAAVPFRVGDAVTPGLHMVQLWVRFQERAEEVLVIYPPDGYWRARPLPPAHMRATAYGASFLVGPVEQAERPLVRLKEIGFTPQTRTFTLRFASGGLARLRLAALDQKEVALEVELDAPLTTPFAALRSMYVTEGNADISRVAWRGTGGGNWGEAPVMTFTDADDVTYLWAGRLVPSRHNTSAPDFVFSGFAGK